MSQSQPSQNAQTPTPIERLNEMLTDLADESRDVAERVTNEWSLDHAGPLADDVAVVLTKIQMVLQRYKASCTVLIPVLNQILQYDIVHATHDRIRNLPDDSVRDLSTIAKLIDSARELLSSGPPASAIAAKIAPKRARGDPRVRAIKGTVRRLYEEGKTQQQIVNVLAGSDRPPNATWKSLRWDLAFKHPKYGTAVRRWLSGAKRG